MLGLAGGTTLHTLRHLLPDCRFSAVDIDAGMVELAREHMALDECGVTIHIADAYEWAGKCRQRFDVVIDDCYLAGEDDVFRPERKPERGINKLRELLNPGGLFLTNLVTGAGHRRMQSRTRAAFKRSFDEVRSITTPASMNETLVGGDAVLSGSALGIWERSFAARKDRVFWQRIQARKIK
jgi:spermidine synthase